MQIPILIIMIMFYVLYVSHNVIYIISDSKYMIYIYILRKYYAKLST